MMAVIVPRRKVIGRNVLKTLKWVFFGTVILFLYFPILYIVIQSFNSSITGHSFAGFTFKWYGEMFRDRNLMDAIRVTISMAIIATIVSVIIGTITAIGINSLNKKKRQRMILLNNVPILNADIVTGVFLMLTFQVVAVFLPGVTVFGYTTMLISHIFFCIPYIILSVLPKLNEIDSNMFDAALDLGCRPHEALWKVIIPTIKGGIITGALIAFTMSIDDFVISYMTGGNGVMNFSMWLYTMKNPFANNAMQKASAYNTLISVGTLLVLVVYNIIKRYKKGLTK